MSKKQLLKAIYARSNGFVGSIPDEETYTKLKNGEIDWKEHVKNQMVAVVIPKEVFYRLMALDIYLDELNEAEEKAALDALNLGESNENCNEDGEADS